MAEIVNLRTARKRKARADKAVKAEENCARYGRSKADKQAETAERDNAARKLDAHQRERADEP